jgi:hypothetical protein
MQGLINFNIPSIRGARRKFSTCPGAMTLILAWAALRNSSRGYEFVDFLFARWGIVSEQTRNVAG